MPIERIKIIELSQFVLNTAVEDIRSELYTFLVAHAFYHKQPEGLSVGKVKEALKEIYGLDVSEELIEESLPKLQSNNTIVPYRKDEFILSENAIKRISMHNEEYRQLREQITSQFLSRIKQVCPNISSSDIRELSNFLFSTLSAIFERYGSLFSSMISRKGRQQNDITAFPDFQSICISNVRKIGDPILRKVTKDMFSDCLNNPSPEFARFLFSLAQSYTIAQIMNFDPTLQALEKRKLSERKLYLDTNVLVSLMTTQESELVRSIVNYNRSLGVKMVFTPTTLEEYSLLLSQAKSVYKKIPPQKESTIEKVEPLMEDPFIKSFWKETKTNKMLSWNGFIVTMEGLKEILSDKYGITLETPSVEIDRNSMEFKTMFVACSNANFSKPEFALRHDAYHLTLVQKLRESESIDELGFHSYFLTRDTSLHLAENFVHEEGRIASSIHISLWLQMISVFVSPKMQDSDPSNTYSRLLGSQFPSLVQSVNPSDLADLMGVWMEDPSINTEVLRRIIGNRYMRENLRKLRWTAKEDPSKISTAVDPVLTTVVSALKEKHEAEKAQREEATMEEMTALKQKYDKEISDLRQQVQNMPHVPQKREPPPKSLWLTGLSLLLVMVVSAIITTYYKIPIPEAVYWILGIGGIALIASYYFGAKVFDKIKW